MWCAVDAENEWTIHVTSHTFFSVLSRKCTKPASMKFPRIWNWFCWPTTFSRWGLCLYVCVCWDVVIMAQGERGDTLHRFTRSKHTSVCDSKRPAAHIHTCQLREGLRLISHSVWLPEFSPPSTLCPPGPFSHWIILQVNCGSFALSKWVMLWHSPHSELQPKTVHALSCLMRVRSLNQMF